MYFRHVNLTRNSFAIYTQNLIIASIESESRQKICYKILQCIIHIQLQVGVVEVHYKVYYTVKFGSSIGLQLSSVQTRKYSVLCSLNSVLWRLKIVTISDKKFVIKCITHSKLWRFTIEEGKDWPGLQFES